MYWKQHHGDLSRIKSHEFHRLRQPRLLHPHPEGALAAIARADGGHVGLVVADIAPGVYALAEQCAGLQVAGSMAVAVGAGLGEAGKERAMDPHLD